MLHVSLLRSASLLLSGIALLPVHPSVTLAAEPAARTAPAPAQQDRRPNILVILADDLGYGEVGFQGYKTDISTPNLDRLAANGTRFTSGYVSGTYCSPTRAALLTGRYQQRTGHEFNPAAQSRVVYGDAPGLALSEKTIGDRLKAAGYATGWFGKSHQGTTPAQHPLRRGFDEFYGFLGGAHGYLDTGGGVNAIQDDGKPVAVDADYYTTDAFTDHALDFIGRNQGKPWFAYLAYNAVHGPLQATAKYEDRFKGIGDPKRRKFAAMLSALDDSVGRVLDQLRASGQEDHTLVVFFSDNGGPTAQTTSDNGPLRGFKAQTWEGGIRVPFALQWKGHIPAGRVENQPVIQLDILPTALAAAGVAPVTDTKLDGVNLLPWLSGQAKAPQRDLYWRFGAQLAVRHGEWKLVKAIDREAAVKGGRQAPATVDGAQLYNLASDIGEVKDLAAANPDTVRELAASWNAWNAGLAKPRWYPVRGKGKGKRAGRRAAATPEAQ